MLTRLNVSALIWRSFGFARAADDIVYFCWTVSKPVSLEELQGHGTLSRHSKEGSLDRSSSDWLCVCFLWSHLKYVKWNLTSFFIIRSNVGFSIRLDICLISRADCKCLLFYMIIFHLLGVLSLKKFVLLSIIVNECYFYCPVLFLLPVLLIQALLSLLLIL